MLRAYPSALGVAILRGLAGSAATAPASEQPHRPGQQLVLERAQRRQHLLGTAGIGQLDGPLQDHRPAVHAGVDEVDGHAEHLDPVGEGLLDRAEPRKGRQQRGVDVDDGAGEASEEALAEQLHVAGQHDQAGAAGGDPVPEGLVAGAAVGVVAAGEHGGRHATLAGALQRLCLRRAGGDGDDLRLLSVDGVEQRLQVGARSGDEHGDRESLGHAPGR